MNFDLPRVLASERAYTERFHHVETECFKRFTCDELTRRDKANLDLFWLKYEASEDSAKLPAPGIIAADIVGNLEQFSEIEAELKETP